MKIQYQAIASFAVLALTSACSPSGNLSLKTVDLTTSDIGGSTYVNMTANVGTGNLMFPSIDIPVINPKTLEQLGQFSLATISDGTNQIALSLNYDAVTHLDSSGGGTLPNGREIPLSLGVSSDVKLISIPILQSSKIYVGGDLQKNFYIGTAIAIAAFDTAMSNVGMPLNIFFGLPFSNQVTGFAGLFTGTASGQSGLGVFVKKSAGVVSSVVAKTDVVSKSQSRVAVSSESNATALNIHVSAPANANRTGGEELNRVSNSNLVKLNNLFKKKATLKIK